MALVLNWGVAEPWGTTEDVGVPPISKFDWDLLVNCRKGCHQIVKNQGRMLRLKKVEKHWGKEGVIQIIHDTFLLNLKTP